MAPSTAAARPDQIRLFPAIRIPLHPTVRGERGPVSGIHATSASSTYACHVLPEPLSDAIHYTIYASSPRSNRRVGFVSCSESDGPWSASASTGTGTSAQVQAQAQATGGLIRVFIHPTRSEQQSPSRPRRPRPTFERSRCCG